MPKKATNGRSPQGRRGKGFAITKKQRELYIAALREGATHEKAAQEAGRSREGFKDMRQRDETFALVVAEACDAGCEMVEQQLVDIAFGRKEAKNNAQVTACFGILRARRPEVWRENHREPEHRPRQRINTAHLSDEEIDVLRGLLAKSRG